MLVFIMSHVLAEKDPHEGKRKVEALWPIFRFDDPSTILISESTTRKLAIFMICFTNPKPSAKVP